MAITIGLRIFHVPRVLFFFFPYSPVHDRREEQESQCISIQERDSDKKKWLSILVLICSFQLQEFGDIWYSSSLEKQILPHKDFRNQFEFCFLQLLGENIYQKRGCPGD
jgi:hypothetical protein